MGTPPRFFGRHERADESVLTAAIPPVSADADLPIARSLAQLSKASLSAAMDGGSKLIVGPRIKLKGNQITDCDTLVVEGRVEATLDARVMQIAEQGAFDGTAQIDIMEVCGRFEGTLNVRHTLAIRSTGVVAGKIRYGRIVIEEGGQVSGDVSCVAMLPGVS